MAKRSRTGHLIAGLGDGNVHNTVRSKLKTTLDDLFLRRSKDRAYIRGSKGIQVGIVESIDRIGNASTLIPKTETAPYLNTSWHLYVMALILIMGFLVAIFLNLVADGAITGDEDKRSRRSTHKHKKKKTDEWSDDCATDSYVADNEGIIRSDMYSYYPKEPEYPKHRKKDQIVHSHRNYYFSAEQPSMSLYRSPSNSYYSHQESPTQYGTPVWEGISGVDASSVFVQKSKAKRLSPVSSFASMQDSGHQSDSSGKLPLPRGVTRGSENSSSSIKFSPRLLETETPKAGQKRSIVDIKLHPLEITPFDASPTLLGTPVPLPFIPNLAGMTSSNWRYSEPPQSVSIQDLHSEMESGNIQHDPEFTAALAVPSCPPESNTFESSFPSFALNPQDKPELEMESSDDESPRKNIIHKRKNLTQSTDTTKSLLSTIRFDELQLEEVIGGGGFGQVWRATWRSTPVAVKILTGSAQRVNVSKAILEEFAAEINMLKGMRHPNICLYMGACLEPPNRAIVTELAANGSLWDALRLPLHPPYVAADGLKNDAWPSRLYPDKATPSLAPKGTWPWILVKRVACGAARGMTYLHSGLPPVLHRDLKSANLLLDESYTAKVCDFGLSRLKAQERSMTGNCGTVQWMAPEILASQHYAEPADVFSFGIILWELLTAECPFEGMTAIQCALAVLNRDQRPTIPSWCPPALESLIGSCVKRDPDQRPTFAQVCLALEAMPS
jgi:Protein tyrosine and serine/threonine kinase